MAKELIALDTIMNESLWVAKMQGWRETGTYAEIGHLAKSEECRDFDLLANQPEHLKPFFDAYWAWNKEHGWITIPEFYKDIYLVDMQTPEQDAKLARRVWTEDEIRHLIATNDKVLINALMKLYAEQTADERSTGETRHNNGRGFNGTDSRFLSSVAEFYKKRGFLTDKQKACVRRKLAKYNRQLTRLANAG